MAEDIVRELAEALEDVDADYARIARDKMTDVEVCPAPFLHHYKICKVLNYGMSHPVFFYAAFAPGKKAYVLTGESENFAKMAQEDSISINSEEEAAQYAAVYLDVTRPTDGLFYAVKSVDEIKFRGLLDEDDEKLKEHFIEKYRSRIVEPHAEPMGNGYSVTAYVVHDQNLERHSIAISRRGVLQQVVKVLEEDLPLMFGG